MVPKRCSNGSSTKTTVKEQSLVSLVTSITDLEAEIKEAQEVHVVVVRALVIEDKEEQKIVVSEKSIERQTPPMSAENTPTPATSTQTTGATDASSSTAPMMTQQPSVVSSITPFGNSMGKSFAIKLDRNNYTLWKTMVTTVIKGHRLDGYLFGTCPCPPEFILTEITAQGATGFGLRLNPNYEQWVVNDHHLMGWLYGSMTESVATQVMGCSTSANLWTTLENLYGAHSKSKMNAVRTSIQTTRKGTISMEEYLKQMKSWADVLAIAGDPYPEPLLISNVFSGLDADYMPIVVLIESRESISWQELQDTLLSYDIKLEHINSLNKIAGAPSANFVTSRGGNSNFNKNYSQSQPSNQSGGRGQNTGRSRGAHCYNRYDESYMGASSNSNQNNQNQPSVFVATPETVDDECWYADSGANNHVTRDANNLNQKVEYNGKNSLMDTQEVESSSSLNQGASLPDHARADTQEVESSSSLNQGASLLDHATPVNSQVHETNASQNIPSDGPLCSQVPVKAYEESKEWNAQSNARELIHKNEELHDRIQNLIGKVIHHDPGEDHVPSLPRSLLENGVNLNGCIKEGDHVDRNHHIKH
ncbi:hypothetical protein LWI29_015583 [Acer saccharum]|uniref:Retrotransposon Copia-like N-terminal domain-containing protein n=1 Tax=Acer saccharum TaxID=4024 RepID=A0AA39TT52_ACESA|nr:hypothetical protein LWI29_015583 [Acer saccharum]